jgi:hypothetical protein
MFGISGWGHTQQQQQQQQQLQHIEEPPTEAECRLAYVSESCSRLYDHPGLCSMWLLGLLSEHPGYGLLVVT